MAVTDTYTITLDISKDEITAAKNSNGKTDTSEDGGIINTALFLKNSLPFATKVKVTSPEYTTDLSGCYLKIHSGFAGSYINVFDKDDNRVNRLTFVKGDDKKYTVSGEKDKTNGISLLEAANVLFTATPPSNFSFQVEIMDGCFPKNAMVQTPEGEKQCGKLKINDMVLVGDNKYEKIVLFSHFDRNVASNFTQLTLSNGKTVTATGSHLITVFNGKQEILKSFDSLTVGDKVQYNNKLRSVESKAEVVGKGLVCPVTASGNIVVDNVLCTCHASRSSMKVLTPIVHALAAADINVPNKLVKRYNAIR